jgi:hypothetical protein
MNQYTEDFWTHAETLGEHLARRGLDRREFLGWCARMAMLMGVGPVVAEGLNRAQETRWPPGSRP